jgi:hypothetical protein
MENHVKRSLMLVLLALLAAALAPLSARAAPLQRERCFAETGFCVSGVILDYWERNGGLPVFGYPISTQQVQNVEGTWSGPVQWFERDRLEDHSNEGKGVLAGRLGAFYLERTGHPWVMGNNDPHHGYELCQSFTQTGYSVCAPFSYYWQHNGGLARFGYPITPAMQETVEGKTYLVQYFERRRMEYHPENAAPYDVLLGLLARDIVRAEPCPPLQDTALLNVVKRYFRPNGCPKANIHEYVPAAIQQFEHGWMLWVGPQENGPKDSAPMIFALTSSGMNWKWQIFGDSYQEGEPVGGAKTPPSGLIAPARGFGKVWWNNPSLQNELGWAVAPEQSDTASWIVYDNGGWMVHMFGPNRVFVLQSGGFGSVETP